MNRTEHNWQSTSARMKRRTWRLRRRRRRLKLAMAPAPKLGALASLRLHWPEYLMEAGLLGAFMVSACVFGALYEFPQSPVQQAIMSAFPAALSHGDVHGADRHRDHLFAMGKAVGCPHQPIGDVHFFPARQNQGMGRPLLYRRRSSWERCWECSWSRIFWARSFRSGSSLRRYDSRTATGLGWRFSRNSSSRSF